MRKYLKDEDIINLIKSRITYDYRQKELAKDMKISTAYMSDLLSGKRGFADKVLKFLGYEKVYRRVE